MSNTRVQNDPVYQLPFLYINGLIVSNDLISPLSVIDISAGQCRDSNDVMDITVGISNPNLEGNYVAAPLIVNGLVNGINGLDIGNLANNTLYAVYVIADSRYYKQPAGILSLSFSGPLMPFGYDSYRLVGSISVNSVGEFIPQFISGNNNSRILTYDFNASVIPGGTGHATAYTPINLSAFVPPFDNLPIIIKSTFIGTTITSTLNVNGGNFENASYVVLTQVTGQAQYTNAQVISQLVSGVPTIDYKVSVSGDSAIIYVSSFNFYV